MAKGEQEVIKTLEEARRSAASRTPEVIEAEIRAWVEYELSVDDWGYPHDYTGPRLKTEVLVWGN